MTSSVVLIPPSLFSLVVSQENVHLSSRNLHTLHTSPGCSLPPVGRHRRQSGHAKTNNCDVNAVGQWSNEGCGVESAEDRTWGKGFNEDGGGIVVMKWTEKEGILFWQFRKGHEPEDLKMEGKEVDSETWGLVSPSFHHSESRGQARKPGSEGGRRSEDLRRN